MFLNIFLVIAKFIVIFQLFIVFSNISLVYMKSKSLVVLIFKLMLRVDYIGYTNTLNGNHILRVKQKFQIQTLLRKQHERETCLFKDPSSCQNISYQNLINIALLYHRIIFCSLEEKKRFIHGFLL